MELDIDHYLGSRVRALREQRELTQQELAHRAGLAIQTVSRVERGRIGLSVGRLADICRALAITLSDFFAGVDLEPEELPPETRRVVATMQTMTPTGRRAVLRTVEAIDEALSRPG